MKKLFVAIAVMFACSANAGTNVSPDASVLVLAKVLVHDSFAAGRPIARPAPHLVEKALKFADSNNMNYLLDRLQVAAAIACCNDPHVVQSMTEADIKMAIAQIRSELQ